MLCEPPTWVGLLLLYGPSLLPDQLVVSGVLWVDIAGCPVHQPAHRELGRNSDAPWLFARTEHPVPKRCRDAVIAAGIGKVVMEVMSPQEPRVRASSRMAVLAAVQHFVCDIHPYETCDEG